MFLKDKDIAQSLQIACLLEAGAEKPGNITPSKSFSDLNYRHFLFSAAAVFPAFLNIKNKSVGEMIYEAVKETHSLIDSNTNLGIILLCTPIASAYVRLREKTAEKVMTNDFLKRLRKELHLLLTQLDKKDAELAYKAINLSQAGNLDKVDEGDISKKPDMTLYQSMKLAEDRDNIAFEYVNNFKIIFEFAYPRFLENDNQLDSINSAIIKTYLEILAEYPDSLIARKSGVKKAEEVSNTTKKLLKNIKSEADLYSRKISEFDNYLRNQTVKLNPGTTADLITAVIFLRILAEGKSIIQSWAE